ncbi:MAG: TldD/PmbA family protein, partial [Myxococcaceae bacterium]
MLSAIVALALTAAPSDSRLTLLDAMADELKRNQTQLKLEEAGPPYFISYQVKDYDSREVDARYGALFNDEVDHDRKIYVDVRTGSYDFDNSIEEDMDFNFSMKGTSYVVRKQAPIDDDPAALRNALWLITDEKYKSALFNLLKKKGENVYTVKDPKRPPSFSKEKPSSYVQEKLEFGWDREGWKQRARELSARFLLNPHVIDSDVLVTGDKTTRFFV